MGANYYVTESTTTTAVLVASIISLIVSLAVVVLLVFVCRKLALNKNLSKHFMWFGLLGIIGVIIVAVWPAKGTYNPYMDPRNNPNNSPYMNQNPYGQNQFGQNPYGQNQFGQNQFGQNPYGQGQFNQGQFNQNQFGQNTYGQNQFTQGSNMQTNATIGAGKVCGKCGASVGDNVDACPFCGNRVN